jgi:2-dehydropantoate 2-reductase
LRIISPHGDATLRPGIVTAGTIEAPYDLVLLSVKAFALERRRTISPPPSARRR